MEVIVSMDFAHIWKFFLGEDLGDVPIGFLGFTSSLMIIAEGFRKALRDPL